MTLLGHLKKANCKFNFGRVRLRLNEIKLNKMINRICIYKIIKISPDLLQNNAQQTKGFFQNGNNRQLQLILYVRAKPK